MEISGSGGKRHKRRKIRERKIYNSCVTKLPRGKKRESEREKELYGRHGNRWRKEKGMETKEKLINL